MPTRVAINGLGRIGRATLKVLRETPELELVAVNDVVPGDVLAYMLHYDSVYGRYGASVAAEDGNLIVDDDRYQLLHERDPANLPWGQLGVDVVFECTGVFEDREDLVKHIRAGARTVILSTDTGDQGVATVVHGVNRPGGAPQLVSCASCTTNSVTPVLEVLGRRIGVRKAIMSTVHAYTATQELVDSPSRKLTRGRAGAINLVPTDTGAARATTKALPEFQGRFDGVAVRVPVPVGSISDIVVLTERPTSREEINDVFREEAGTERYRGIMGVTDDPLVSTDIIRDPRAAIIDLSMTRVVDGDLVKVMSWYDNEWGYANQMVREAARMSVER